MTIADEVRQDRVSLREAARVAGVSADRLHHWVRNGILDGSGRRRKIPHAKLGGRYLIRVADVREFIIAANTPGEAGNA